MPALCCCCQVFKSVRALPAQVAALHVALPESLYVQVSALVPTVLGEAPAETAAELLDEEPAAQAPSDTQQ